MSDASALHPLKAYRRQQGLSQSQLALRAGVATSTICRIEARDLNPTAEVIARIVDATGGAITPEQLGSICPTCGGVIARSAAA